MATVSGGHRIDCTITKGVFSYRDKTPATTSIQDTLYADDLTLVDESRGELQHMINGMDSSCR